ncbi:MAG: ATP-binding protein [Desulfobacterales bacterium]|jgi:signal transduction histidine kinase/ActR/RegA family two-component response regulator
MRAPSTGNSPADTIATDALHTPVLDALEVCVAVVKNDGRLVTFNSAWQHWMRRFIGRSVKIGDRAILLDEHFPENLPRSHNRRRVAGLKAVVQGRREHFACDLVDPLGDRESWYRVDACPLASTAGMAVLSISDVSNHKRAEKALRRNQDQLIQSQKMEALGSLVAGMAHEINNPTSLIMFNLPIVKRVWKDVLPLLKDSSRQGKPVEFGGYRIDFLERRLEPLIDDMAMAANRISKIVKDLRNFSRRSQLRDKAPVDINAAVAAALRLAQTTMRKSGVELTLDLADDLPMVEGNPIAIEQVALNVIINAIQAIDHDRGRIRIQTRHHHSEGSVAISVRDNGRGISPDIADKLFDPFVTDKQGQGGTGLGLAVSYNLIEAHDGRITFADADDGGTVFSLMFPIESQQQRPRVLVVDDDAMVRRVMVQAIGQTGQYRLDEAANGVDGLIKIGSQPPDLLILDLMMPGMNGREVCEAIHGRTSFAAMKVLITTGHPHHPDLKAIEALGYKDIHTKPIQVESFRKAIATIMGPP